MLSREEFLKMTIADLRPPPDELPQRMLDLAKIDRRRGDISRPAASQKNERSSRSNNFARHRFDGQPGGAVACADVTDRIESRDSCGSRRRWKRSASLPAASPRLNNILMSLKRTEEKKRKLTRQRRAGCSAWAAAVDRAAQFTVSCCPFPGKQPLRAQVHHVTSCRRHCQAAETHAGFAGGNDRVLSGDLWPVKVDRSQLERRWSISASCPDAIPMAASC